jgi:DNA end-binding protein Ku
MASRPSWDGYLKFNLISVPVKGYNAAVSGGGKLGAHLLHKKCNSRIRYQKVCPVCGEVDNDEIVSGYEVSKGHYVHVQAEEKGELKAEDDKAITVETFVPPDAIDPLYFSGRTYFLVPDGKVAHKPYGVLLEAMREHGRYAVAQVVFAGRAQLAVVRPCDNVLAMSLLSYESEVKKPSAFAGEVEHPSATAEERKLAGTLIEAATSDAFDLSSYRDEYTGKLMQLIERKAKRSKPAAAKGREEPAVINLMDALKQSLSRTQKPAKAARGAKGSKRAAGRSRKPAHPRRKTG